ncbi:MAG: T9SS type A sorting domain-containing protein, partial [Bacteroidota bacterium]
TGSGIGSIVLLSGANNLSISVKSFTAGDTEVKYVVKLDNAGQSGSGTVEVRDVAGNVATQAVSLSPSASASAPASSAVLPDVATLYGSYPNPFGATTTLRFALPEASDVQLAVYDVTGREVARLVDGSVESGFHSATFDGSLLPSGVYVVRLSAGSTVETHRMVLAR